MLTLYKNFKYNNRYDYIRTFSTKAEQDEYFNSLSKIYYDLEGDYIRENEPFMIELSHKYLVENNINYIKFNNGYRDIYGFIIEKRYENDEVTEIIFEIDVIQTFMFDFEIKKSFVERKVCNVNEITDFDEGLDIGEHIIETEHHIFDKDSTYFAMFNGFKEQELIFNDNGKLVSVADIPYATAKPQTTIDGILYPIYFMKLLDTSQYAEPLFSEIGIGTGGSQIVGQVISKKLFRFIKGYEAFASESYLDSGGVPTIGYGITDRNPYWSSLFPLCTEQKASEVLAETIYNNYAVALYKDMQSCGVDMATVKQCHFDAFLDLCYNGGLGAVTSSPMYNRWIINQNDGRVTDEWGSWYVRDNNGTVLNGLIDRRKKEIAMFNNGIYEYRAIQIVGTLDIVTDNEGNGFIPSNLGGEL